MWAFLTVTLVVEVLEHVEMFYRGREGILTSLFLLFGPLFALWLLARLLPPWLPRRATSV